MSDTGRLREELDRLRAQLDALVPTGPTKNGWPIGPEDTYRNPHTIDPTDEDRRRGEAYGRLPDRPTKGSRVL